MAKHAFCHIEWSVTDLERSKAFYAGLFDWKFEPWGEEYLVFSTPQEPDGGLMKVNEVSPGSSPVVYVEVEEIEPYLEKARELGGGVDAPKTEIPNLGWFANLKDPDGNLVGLFQGKPQEE